jgi:hypothetical protein
VTFFNNRTSLARPPRIYAASAGGNAEVEEMAQNPKENSTVFERARLMQ